ncbi:hypothetical protein [Arthrobacter psychrolactophilus]
MLLSPGESSANKLARGWLAVLAGVVAVALTFAALIGMGNSAANAATPGSITTTVITGGEKYDGIPVVKEGETLTMRVTYKDSVGAGSSVSIDLGANVTLGDVPAGNNAVESITKDPQNPNAVIVKFK